MKVDLPALEKVFIQQFKHAPSHFVQAPGRVNLIGEHTDYNDGFVLPCAIDYQAVVACHKRDDNIVNVMAINYNEMDSFTVSDTINHSEKLWANYIRGVIQTLTKKGFAFNGADIVVVGNVPQGAGLSSSAALEVVIAQTFKTLYSLDISQTDIALIGQQAENEYVGCNCGIMDQLISASGETDKALLIDCRSLDVQSIIMPESLAVMIVNSNKQRGLVDSEYNSRRQQCEEASKQLNVIALRDATIDNLHNSTISQEDPIYQRARHVITENARTLAMAEALKKGDVHRISQLMAQSHMSMRDDFAITVPEIDYLVDIISEVIKDTGGVRMTGGGFGGCVVALVPHNKIDTVKQTIIDNYTQQTGLVADIYICSPSSGAGEIKL